MGPPPPPYFPKLFPVVRWEGFGFMPWTDPTLRLPPPEGFLYRRPPFFTVPLLEDLQSTLKDLHRTFVKGFTQCLH